MPALRELTMRYGALDDVDDVMDWSLFLDFGGEGRGDMALLPRLRYLDLAGLRIPLHPVPFIQKVAPSLTHLRLPMRMAGRLERALGLGAGVAPDRGAEDGGVALGIPTHFQSPTITTPTQKLSLLPTATLQHVYIQPPLAPKPHWGNNNFSYEREVYI